MNKTILLMLTLLLQGWSIARSHAQKDSTPVITSYQGVYDDQDPKDDRGPIVLHLTQEDRTLQGTMTIGGDAADASSTWMVEGEVVWDVAVIRLLTMEKNIVATGALSREPGSEERTSIVFTRLTGTSILPERALLDIQPEKPRYVDSPKGHKERRPALGSDRDAHGCKPSTGHTWSELKRACIRLWEVGTIQLESADGAANNTARFLISDDKRDAELFNPERLMLKGTGDVANEVYTGGGYELRHDTGWILKKDGVVMYK